MHTRLLKAHINELHRLILLTRLLKYFHVKKTWLYWKKENQTGLRVEPCVLLHHLYRYIYKYKEQRGSVQKVITKIKAWRELPWRLINIYPRRSNNVGRNWGGVESNYSKAEKQECDNRFPPQNLVFQERHVYFSYRKLVLSYSTTVGF